MFMRLVQMKINPEKIFEFERTYEQLIIPQLQQTPGCVYAGLVQSLEDQADGLSLTLWERQQDAVAYERSGVYARLLDASRPFFSNATEWKLQLSDDLELQFGPVAEEPVVKSYAADVPDKGKTDLTSDHPGSVYLRIVSMRINPEKIKEFVEIYEQEIIPALQRVEGCRDAYLAEGVRGDNEVLSITIWESLDRARTYEATGEFDKLKQKVQHTFSNLALWKMGLDEEIAPETRRIARRAVTSDDVAVRTYSVVVGKAFR